VPAALGAAGAASLSGGGAACESHGSIQAPARARPIVGVHHGTGRWRSMDILSSLAPIDNASQLQCCVEPYRSFRNSPAPLPDQPPAPPHRAERDGPAPPAGRTPWTGGCANPARPGAARRRAPAARCHRRVDVVPGGRCRRSCARREHARTLPGEWVGGGRRPAASRCLLPARRRSRRSLGALQPGQHGATRTRHQARPPGGMAAVPRRRPVRPREVDEPGGAVSRGRLGPPAQSPGRRRRGIVAQRRPATIAASTTSLPCSPKPAISTRRLPGGNAP